MPNVVAKPVMRDDGSTVTEFVDVTSTVAVSYTFPAAQNKLSITNQGSSAISVTVGTETDIVIQPLAKRDFTATFTSFSIKSTVNSQAFRAKSTINPATLDASLLATKAELATYETKANATATYATKAQITPLAVKTEVAATYQTIALAETKANATATYATIANAETKTNAANLYLTKTAAESTYGKVKTVNGKAPDAAGNVVP